MSSPTNQNGESQIGHITTTATCHFDVPQPQKGVAASLGDSATPQAGAPFPAFRERPHKRCRWRASDEFSEALQWPGKPWLPAFCVYDDSLEKPPTNTQNTLPTAALGALKTKKRAPNMYMVPPPPGEKKKIILVGRQGPRMAAAGKRSRRRVPLGCGSAVLFPWPRESTGRNPFRTTLKPEGKLFVGLYRGIIIAGFLRWCITSTIHSITTGTGLLLFSPEGLGKWKLN